MERTERAAKEWVGTRDPLFEGAHFHSLFLFTYFIYILYKIEILFKKNLFLGRSSKIIISSNSSFGLYLYINL